MTQLGMTGHGKKKKSWNENNSSDEEYYAPHEGKGKFMLYLTEALRSS